MAVFWVEKLVIMIHNESIKIRIKAMSYKIQITVDEQFSKTLKVRAKEMGLSVSSYARLALMRVVPHDNKNNKLLDQAMVDIQTNNIDTLTLAAFNAQLNNA
jgi:hypothetical protein